jgi:hypothetical protein
MGETVPAIDHRYQKRLHAGRFEYGVDPLRLLEAYPFVSGAVEDQERGVVRRDMADRRGFLEQGSVVFHGSTDQVDNVSWRW